MRNWRKRSLCRKIKCCEEQEIVFWKYLLEVEGCQDRAFKGRSLHFRIFGNEIALGDFNGQTC
jgi:hypothetical protein